MIDNSVSHPHSCATLDQRVMSAIVALGYSQHNQLRCECTGSTIRLSGKVSTFYLSQLAQTVALNVPGVQRVVNKIAVAK